MRCDSTLFGDVDETTTTKFTGRACALFRNSLPVVVDKVVVVVLKAWFPYDRPDRPDRPSRLKKCSHDRDDRKRPGRLRRIWKRSQTTETIGMIEGYPRGHHFCSSNRE